MFTKGNRSVRPGTVLRKKRYQYRPVCRIFVTAPVVCPEENLRTIIPEKGTKTCVTASNGHNVLSPFSEIMFSQSGKAVTLGTTYVGKLHRLTLKSSRSYKPRRVASRSSLLPRGFSQGWKLLFVLEYHTTYTASLLSDWTWAAYL